MSRIKSVAVVFVVLGVSAMLGLRVQAYSTYAKWGTSSVDFYINANNADAPPVAVEASLIEGARIWTTQSDAAFQFVYAGSVTDTATANDGRNVVFFRNATNGGAIASTYSWWSGSTLVDSDIIFWDDGFTFFAGSSGCGGSNAAYIVDIAAHEFGHALGLGHSTVPGATMVSGYSTCSMTQRTIEADDIAGVEALYPSVVTANSAPAITISSPTNAVSVTEGTGVIFSGSASDDQDGDLGPSLVWVSSRDGQIGTGTYFQRVLSIGIHTITARVTDSLGATAEAQRSVTVRAVPAGPPPFIVSGKAYKVKGVQRVDLTWSGATSSLIDIYRNNAPVAVAPNTGVYTDPINQKGGGTYTYVLCHVATSVCSNSFKVTF